VIDAISARFDTTVEELIEARETITFKLPRLLTA
jgi:4-hydroxy-3-methylbut-2-en-1-yl diphosphate reductase